MWDEEDDLLYLRSRYYAPKIGRFMTRDAFTGFMDNPLSMHKYAYVENSPVNWVDPMGFNKKEAGKRSVVQPPNPIPIVTGSVIISQSGKYNYDSKISGQMIKRGWNELRIDEAITNPSRTVNWIDTRFRPDGGQNFDPATVYYHKKGGYVVRNNITKNIVQVSDVNNPNWKAPWDDDNKGGGSGGGSESVVLDGVTYVKNTNGEWEPIPFTPIPIGGGTFPIRIPIPEPIPIPVF